MGRETDRAMGRGSVGQAGPIGKLGKVGAIGRGGGSSTVLGTQENMTTYRYNGY